MARHVALQAAKSGGSFSDYLNWSPQPPAPGEGKVRNLLLLPLWHDSLVALQRVIADGSARDPPGGWRQRGGTRGQAAKGLLLEGAALWLGLVVISLNHMYGERVSGRPPRPGSTATSAQEAALQRIYDKVLVFIDDKGDGGVPRTREEDWEAQVEKFRISYSGEVIEKAQELTLRQVLPALPGAQHGGAVDGGAVDILEVLDEEAL